MSAPRKQEAGFTFVEVMMAMMVFMIATMGMIALQSASTEALQKSRETTHASNLAQHAFTQLENEVRSWDFTGWQDPPTSGYHMLAGPWEERNFDSWYMLPKSNDPEQLAKTVRFDEYWQDSTLNNVAYYCVNYKIQPVDQAAANAERAMVWQISVRVTWPKTRQYDGWDDCTPTVIDAAGSGSGGSRLDNSYAVEVVGVASRSSASGNRSTR